MVAARLPKLLTFGWCVQGQHDECKVSYGDPANIMCDCTCTNHGVNKKPVAQYLSDAEIKKVAKEFGKAPATTEKKTYWGDEDYKYKWVPSYDAETIEELERRRRKP